VLKSKEERDVDDLNINQNIIHKELS